MSYLFMNWFTITWGKQKPQSEEAAGALGRNGNMLQWEREQPASACHTLAPIRQGVVI